MDPNHLGNVSLILGILDILTISFYLRLRFPTYREVRLHRTWFFHYQLSIFIFCLKPEHQRNNSSILNLYVMKNVFLITACFAMLAIGCKTNVDIEKEKNAALESFNQWVNALQDEDAEMLESILCDDPDMVMIGTDAPEFWKGKDAFIDAQKKFFEATSESKIEIHNISVKLSESGTVAWISCLMNWDILSGEQLMHLDGLRMTAVLEKRDGQWVIVQGHGSVPVSGQMIEY
jgi:uncharacterized protein (TIGR02246 family)